MKIKQNGQKGEFFSTFLGTLGASLLGDLLRGVGVIRLGKGATRMSQGGRRQIRVVQDFQCHFIR